MKNSIWNHNRNKFIKEARRLRALCQRIIDGEESIIEGALKMDLFRFWMKEENNAVWDIFRLVSSDSDHLPTKKTRHLWAKHVLTEKDQEIAEIENFYRDEVIKAAEIIRRAYQQHIE